MLFLCQIGYESLFLLSGVSHLLRISPHLQVAQTATNRKQAGSLLKLHLKNLSTAASDPFRTTTQHQCPFFQPLIAKTFWKTMFC